MRHKVSAVMIVYNEAAIIENTLKALQWCDEIIVVDSGSTDNTWALCEQYGCRLFSRDFDGYGPQKRFAMAQARYDWILSIDADEVISEVLQKEMSVVLAQENIPAVGYHLPRTMIFLGKKINSEYGKPCLRLFHKDYGQVTLDKVHEKIQVQGEIHTLKGQLWHYSYRSIHDYFYKFNKYTSFAAEELFAAGKRKPKWLVMIRLPFSFFQIYVLKGCFLNGFAGFVWALFSSFYPVVKYTKLIEMYQQNKGGNATSK